MFTFHPLLKKLFLHSPLRVVESCSLLILFALLCFSCTRTSSSESAAEDAQGVDVREGVYLMEHYEWADSVAFAGHAYVYNITREPADSAGKVLDTDGAQYSENIVRLRIHRDGQLILLRTFTKEDFAPYIEPSFLSRSILEGMAFNRVAPEGLLFAASVGLPLSDEYVQLRLTVAADGSVSIRRDEIVDENLADDDSLSVR